MADAPIVDPRDGDEVLEEAQEVAPAYTGEWDPDADDVGSALLTLFSAMAEDVIERLNRVPEKHRVAFFDTLGFSREPPQPARLPVTFQITDDVEENVVIEEGTRTMATARDKRPAQIFELPAGGGFEGTPASVEAAYTVDPSADDIFDHRDPLRNGTEAELFTGEDLQKHALLVGHVDALTLKSNSRIWMTIDTNAEPSVFADRLKWEFFGEAEPEDEEADWQRIRDVRATPIDGGTVTVRLVLPEDPATETTETEFGGIESRWIRCRIPMDAELHEESSASGSKRLPQDLFDAEIRSVELSLVAPDADAGMEILLDDLVSGDVLLEAEPRKGTAVDLYPLGEAWPLRNVFYVASEEAFTKEDATVNLEFEPPAGAEPEVGEGSDTDRDQPTPVSGRNPKLSWEYWNGEGWARLADLDDDTNQLQNSGMISFTVPGDLEPTTAAGHRGHWIRARVVSGEYVRVTYDEDDAQDGKVSMSTAGVPPHFGGVRISYNAANGPVFQPGAVLTRNNLAYSENLAEALTTESSTTERPFFGLLDSKQTLYLGFDGELRDGPINLLFSLADEEYPDGFYPRVRWEYCADPDRDEWARLDAEDGTESLTESGIVSLGFREATVPSGRFGRRLHWIRARLAGDEFVPTVDGGRDPGALPVTITTIDPATDRIVISNTDDRELDLGGYRIEFPCARSDDRIRMFPPGTTLAPDGSLIIGAGTEPGGPVDTHFEYERPVLADRGANTVAILTPEGELVTRRVQSVPEPCDRWLETVPPAGDPDRSPPIVQGLHPNTGWADNVQRVEGELLGSSDGTPNQKFTVSSPPVTEEAVWVNELSALSEGERLELREARPVDEVAGPDGQPVAFWVRWTRVAHFLDSGRDDRHYRLDPTAGRLTSGDGTRGRIPPRGTDNLRIDYRTGGGTAGNVEAGAVTDLVSSIPFVDSVTNPEPGVAGAEAETVDQVVARAPKELKDRGKAVSREDFERIAAAASRTLSRVRCIPAMDKMGEHSPGWVTVVIVPNDRRTRPIPSVALKRRVSAAVRERAPARLAASGRSGRGAASAPEIVVRGPSYLEVSVEATVRADDVGSISALESRITSDVDAFLHPLTGGETGNGWEFGELPCLSDLYALLEGIGGVDHVVDLSMTFHGDEEAITIMEGEGRPNVSADTLIFSGSHAIEVDGIAESRSTGRR